MGAYHLTTHNGYTLWFYNGHSHRIMSIEYLDDRAEKVVQIMLDELNFLESNTKGMPAPKRANGTYYLTPENELIFYDFATNRHHKILRPTVINQNLAVRALEIVVNKLNFHPPQPQKPQPTAPGRTAATPKPVKKKKARSGKYPQLSLFDHLEGGRHG